MASPRPQSLKGKSAVTSNSVTQMVNMHMEKVARREIGTLATIQRLPPGQKIIAPENLPHLTPYYRRPLNFSCLDDIGHGIKVERGALLFLHSTASVFLRPHLMGILFLQSMPHAGKSPTLFCLMTPFSLEPQFSSRTEFSSHPAAPFLPQSLKPSP